MRQVAPTERVGGEVREQNIGHAFCVAPTRCKLGPTRPRNHSNTCTRTYPTFINKNDAFSTILFILRMDMSIIKAYF